MKYRNLKFSIFISAVFLAVFLLSGCSENNYTYIQMEEAREMGYEKGKEDGYGIAIDDIESGAFHDFDSSEICSDYYDLGYEEAKYEIEKHGIERVKSGDIPREP